jgi:hypothetical protein
MLVRETVAVYCENRTEHTNTLCGQNADFLILNHMVHGVRRWVDNIKMDLREIGWDGMDWIDLTHDRDQWRALVNTEMNLRVP